jgi:hypothetical protein
VEGGWIPTFGCCFVAQPLSDAHATPAGGFNLVSPVKDQSLCGSCVAFALMGTAESTAAAVMRRNAAIYDFSEAPLLAPTSTYQHLMPR